MEMTSEISQFSRHKETEMTGEISQIKEMTGEISPFVEMTRRDFSFCRNDKARFLLLSK
jgi:hypothetical protein